MFFGLNDAPPVDITLVPNSVSFGPPFDTSLAPPSPVYTPPTWLRVTYGVLATASFALSVFHGYKRHSGSIGWGLGWGFMGALFPVITPTIAFAQGFAKPMRG